MSFLILAAESDPGERDIAESLQSSPQHDGTGMTITFSAKETAEAGNPTDRTARETGTCGSRRGFVPTIDESGKDLQAKPCAPGPS